MLKSSLIFVMLGFASGTTTSLLAQDTQIQGSKTVYFSMCTDFPISETESLEYFLFNDTLLLIHKNAWFNCETKTSSLKIEHKNNEIHLYENPEFLIIKNPDGSTSHVVAMCNCYFTVIYEIKNIKDKIIKFNVDSKYALGPIKSIEINLSKSKSGIMNLNKIPELLKR